MKVFVRVRPFSKDESARKPSINAPFEVSQDATQLHLFQDDKGHAEKTFNFDHVFKMEDNNVTVSVGKKFLRFRYLIEIFQILCPKLKTQETSPRSIVLYHKQFVLLVE